MLTHEYPACKHNLARLAARHGAGVRAVPMPLPLDGRGGDDPPLDADALVETVLGAVTARTRLLLLSHITSPSGVVVPVDRIAARLEQAGVCVVVDGAHGPGAVPFEVPSLGAPFYTANAHKWLGGPKGAGVLWVRRDLQHDFRPLVLSNRAEAATGPGGRSRFNAEFDYVGTDDPTAWMSIADAIEALPAATGLSWEGIMAANRALALRARDLLTETLGVGAPVADELIGPMAMVPLPKMEDRSCAAHAERPTMYADPLQDALVARHGVQVPVWRHASMSGGPFDGRRFVRVSAQRYNTERQYAYLAAALAEELERESAGTRGRGNAPRPSERPEGGEAVEGWTAGDRRADTDSDAHDHDRP
jgi:isopenicillin-N epimerase